jgi:hypothetical protein
MLDGQPGDVRYLGHVPDVTPWFESLRLTVAPIRFGSGMKGKVISSLVAGVPCVITSMAAEGMGLSSGDGILIADEPNRLAELIARVHGDAAIWSTLSTAALVQAESRFSPSAWRRSLAEALWTIDALPFAPQTDERSIAGRNGSAGRAKLPDNESIVVPPRRGTSGAAPER